MRVIWLKSAQLTAVNGTIARLHLCDYAETMRAWIRPFIINYGQHMTNRYYPSTLSSITFAKQKILKKQKDHQSRLVSLPHPVFLLASIPPRFKFPKPFTEYLIVHGIELVAEAHGQICACIWGNMRGEGTLDLTHCIIHVNPPLADLHVLKTRLNAGKRERRVNKMNAKI